jgi:hypothetical protein
MQDVNHAVAVLRELTGLGHLELNRNGHFELIFDDDTPVNFYRIDDHQLELCTMIRPAGKTSAAEALALLTANYLGHGTGAARLALDPRDQTLILCERVDVRPLGIAELQARIEGFVAYAKLWLSGEMDGLVSAKPAVADTLSEMSGFIIRS